MGAMGTWAPINISSGVTQLSILFPTSPFPGVIGEMMRIRLFENSNSLPMGERLVVKSPYSMATVHFRKQVSSYVACKLNKHLEF